MDYTKEDLRNAIEMARDIRYIAFSNDEIVESIIEDKEDRKSSLADLMEISQKAGLYEDDSPKTDFLGRNIEKIFTEVDIADAIYISKVSGKSTYEIIEQLKDRKWPKK